MEISEEEYNSFLGSIEFRNVPLPSTGEVFQMPLVAEKATQMVGIFTASRSKVMNILPIPELVPVEAPGDETILALAGIEYVKRNIPGYNEVLVMIPVFIGKGVTPPTLQDLMKEGFGGCTLFIRHIVVNTRIAEVLGNELLGYAKFTGDIDFIDTPQERICVLSDAGEDILRCGVNSKVEQWGAWERNTMSVATYKNNKIYRLTYQSQARYGANVPPKGWLTFGSHPLGDILAGLEVSAQPIVTYYSPYFQLISDETKLEVFEP